MKIGMKRAHPGSVIRNWILPEDMTVTQAAERLGVARQALDSLLNGRSSLSSEMALRIEKVFHQRMETLMQMQLEYDAQVVRLREKEISKSLRPVGKTRARLGSSKPRKKTPARTKAA